MKCLFCVFGIYSLWPRIISIYLPFEQLKFTIVTIKHKLGIFMRDKSSLTKTLPELFDECLPLHPVLCGLENIWEQEWSCCELGSPTYS